VTDTEAVTDLAALGRSVGGIVDLMIGFPRADAARTYDFMKPALKERDQDTAQFPAGYMFKDVPNKLESDADPIEETLAAMDRCGIAIGLVGAHGDVAKQALKDHPDRFKASIEVDPNDVTKAVRAIRAAKDEHDIKAVTTFPAGLLPQVAVSDAKYYPIYQTCIDLDIPIVTNAGIAGPRVPSACQDVMHFDQVCYDFPELTIVMRHGAEPWQQLAVKLMLKWPGLHYMTSAFAPKYYPAEIIDYANTRGVQKVMYAGYYPMGLSLDRIATELAAVPFRDATRQAFLRDNALRVFKLLD
jgi:predicted TIM-barrel fold metal-dependent hydrolase